ncbi:hypothetical protein NKJ64_22015 [Mesorhizobium sp. M0062]|uniref:hypothetical protein n=1 Tax=Mesorhizobium sp. M0062 TaxID=2956867 RepID=UPI003334B5E6
MCEPFEAQIKEEPALSAASVLQRLTKIDPSEENLRMVQRLVKAWRTEMAGLIILDGGWMTSWPLSPFAATERDSGHVGPIALGSIPR